MKISIRSRVLIYICRLTYGDPTGLKCSPEEFYALSNERAKINAQIFYEEQANLPANKRATDRLYDLHPENGTNWHSMRRNSTVDQVRLNVFKRMAKFGALASCAIFFSGSLLISGVVKGKEVVAEVREKSRAEDAKEAQASTADKQQKIQTRAAAIVEELKELQANANSGKIEQPEFEKKQSKLVEEYKKLQEAL